jgi:hypothetical protein
MSNLAGVSAALPSLLPDDRGVSSPALFFDLGYHPLQLPALRVRAFQPCGEVFGTVAIELCGILWAASCDRVSPAQQDYGVAGSVHSSGGGVGFMRW